VVSRTTLTTTENLVESQEEITRQIMENSEQIKKLRESQSETDERLNTLIDAADRIIRRFGNNGTKQ
jgi:uncharacterized coiled-coil DUF342 family protein